MVSLPDVRQQTQERPTAAKSRERLAAKPVAKPPCLRCSVPTDDHDMSALELRIPPLLVTVIFATLMWLVSRISPEIALPATARMACLLLFTAAGVMLGLGAIAAFRKARTTVNPFTPEASSALVDRGVFRFTRNPMYLALLFALAAWAVFLDNVYSLALTGLFVAYMNRFQIRPEERALDATFGDSFIEYKRRVRRWL